MFTLLASGAYSLKVTLPSSDISGGVIKSFGVGLKAGMGGGVSRLGWSWALETDVRPKQKTDTSAKDNEQLRFRFIVPPEFL
jgi:hypothetical protein